MNDLTKASLIKFLDMMVANGWVNASTGGAMRTSVKKILSVVSDDVTVDTIDVAMALRQYNNLHPGELAPDSLRVYEQRVVRAIRQFLDYKEDPKSFKPSGRGPTTSKAPKQENGEEGKRLVLRRSMARPANSVSGATVSSSAATSGAGGVGKPMSHGAVHDGAAQAVATDLNLALPFPLRPNYLAQVVIPRDLTKDEAERLCAFIKALAQQ